jgi:hypothetical protein
MKITKTEKVKMSWGSFTFPITVGTPVSNGGVLADSASAYGLIVRTIFAKPDADETAEIMTGGVIDMEEIVAGYGQELSSAAVQALCGIHFYKEGVCIPTGGSGGGDDSQKWKEETSTPLFNETVTTVTEGDYATANLAYAQEITSEVLSVVFNGTEFTCYRHEGGSYGAPYTEETDTYDFSEYPFTIETSMSSNDIYVAEPGTYNVSVSAETTTYTDSFIKGVAENSTVYVNFVNRPNVGLVCNKTFSEIQEAYKSGANVVGTYATGTNTEIYNLVAVRPSEVDFLSAGIDRLGSTVRIPVISFRSDDGDTDIKRYVATVSATITDESGGGGGDIG